MTMRRSLPILILMAVATCASSASGEPIDNPSNHDEQIVVIKAGRVITISGDEIPDGEIVLVDGKVRMVGTELKYPKNATIIDAGDETVMPGMVLARTRWQLSSYSRSGSHGDRSVTQEMLVDEIDFEPLQKAGFTAACFIPAGTGIPGPSAVFRTGGKKEDRELGAAYLRVTMSSPSRDKGTLLAAIVKAKAEIAKVEKARKAWDEKQKKAKEEAAKKAAEKKAAEAKDKPKPEPEKKEPEKKSTAAEEKKETPEKKKEDTAKPEVKKPEVFTPPKIDPAVLPLVQWIRDKKGPALMFELGRASDLQHLDDVLKHAPELPGKRFLLTNSSYSSSDYHHVVTDLGRRKALVLLQPGLGNMPYTATRYHVAAELVVAGCTLAIIPRADTAAELKRLPTHLAGLVRAGLPREEALKAVTLGAATVVGLEKRLGSIEKGKDADLIFLDADPLATETKVTRVMTHGEIVWEAPQRP